MCEHHARLVLKTWQMREAREVALRLVENAMVAPIETKPEDVIGEAEKDLFDILNSQIIGGPKRIGPIINDEFVKAGDLPKDGLLGLPTGLPKLNEWTGGWQNGDMVIIAGRPSQGKTNLGLFFSRTLAINHNISVLFFSLEMTKNLLAQRIVCSLAGVDSNKFRRGNFTKKETETLSEWDNKCLEVPLYVDDTKGLTMTTLRSRAKRAIDSGVKMIIVDYLGRLKPEERGRSVYQDVSEWSRRLKDMAGDLNVPVLILCQLNRKPTDQNDSRPRMNHLRDSGSIEQDADVILLLQRPGLEKEKMPRTKMELFVEKQRCGRTGTINLYFDEKTGYIREEDEQHEEVPY